MLDHVAGVADLAEGDTVQTHDGRTGTVVAFVGRGWWTVKMDGPTVGVSGLEVWADHELTRTARKGD